VFGLSLTESEKQANVVEAYEKNIITRTEYQFELVLRKFLSELNSI